MQGKYAPTSPMMKELVRGYLGVDTVFAAATAEVHCPARWPSVRTICAQCMGIGRGRQ
jgi:hypothetical protein